MAGLFFLYILLPIGMSVLIATFLFACYLVVVKGRKPSGWKGAKNYCSGLSVYFSRRQEILNDFPEIYWWWEIRRLPFNILVGTVGIFSSAIFGLGFDQPPSRYHSDYELVPIYLLLCVFYALGANVFFTAGWILESILRAIVPRISNRIGILAFHLGILFSFVLTLSIPLLLLVLQIYVKKELE